MARSPLRTPVADPRGHRHRPAAGRAGRDDRQHRAPVGPAGPGLLRRRSPVDHHRLRAGVRQPAAARRPHRRPLRPQMDVHRRPARLRRRVGARRRGAELRPAGRRARAAGRVRARCSLPPRSRCSPPPSPTRPSAARRSASTARSPAPAARSACCSAACSPRCSTGAGACTSRSCSRSRRRSAGCVCSTTCAAPERPRLDIPGTRPRFVRPVRARVRDGARRVQRLGRPGHARLPGRERGAAGRVRLRCSDGSRTRCFRCAW